MSFKDTVDSAIKSVPARPRGRNSNQTGIDEANQASVQTSATVFDDVQSLIDGSATARPVRKAGASDICDTIIPPNNLPSPGNAGIVSVLSPLSWGEGLNTATIPAVQSYDVAQGFVSVAQFNTSRNRVMIQNIGTGNVYVIFGNSQAVNGDITNAYHFLIAPGETMSDDSWQGRIDIAVDADGTLVSVTELSRVINVSQ